MLKKIRNMGGSSKLESTDIKIIFEGKHLALSNPVCRDINRLYLPLYEFISNLNGSIRLLAKGYLIYLPYKLYTAYLNYENKEYLYNNQSYISLIDLCILLNLVPVWKQENQSIALFYNRNETLVNNTNNSQRPAFLRLEDITAGGLYLESKSLEYLRVIGDFLYSTSVPFHIAFIPKYEDPPNNIYNDISLNYSFSNAEFLFTIDYLMKRGGLIGLHGYTHQYGDEVSGEGTEFNEERNNDEVSIKTRAEKAIRISDKLKIPHKFFESPHYASTEYQQSIFETYFDIMYEGYVGILGENVVKSPRNLKTIYVPTPLDYLEGEEGLQDMITRINGLQDDSLASLFYHPYIEFNHISVIYKENGYPEYHYEINSPLHQIINALLEKNCSFKKVTDLKV